jgi:hypothetical protein
MTKAYLQNKDGKYYILKRAVGKNEVLLVDEKLALIEVPKQITETEETWSPSIYSAYDQVKFTFDEDGYMILANLFFAGKGIESDCILTLEGDSNICGNLDFTTINVSVGQHLEISCVPF